MTIPTCAAAVANAFLDLQERDTSYFPPIDQMKIQKLVYYSAAWWLTTHDDPLFDDDIGAWPWGPVVRNIYGDFANFRREPIKGVRAKELVKAGAGPLDYIVGEPAPPGDDILKFLKQVWDTHKQFTGIQLSNATHGPGEPWTVVKDRYGNLDSKPKIPNALIRDVFQAKLAARAGSNTAA